MPAWTIDVPLVIPSLRYGMVAPRGVHFAKVDLWSLHAIHRSDEDDGSHGGESGLNIGANDVSPVRLINSDTTSQLAGLKRLLDDGAIDQAEFSKLKAKIIG